MSTEADKLAQAEQSMISNIQKNTGKTLEEWIAIVNKTNLSKHSELVNFLKEKHAFSHGFANFIVHKAKASDSGSADSTDSLIEKQYMGKEELKPVYEKLVKAIRSFGPDVEISPKNAYVALRRKKQFALLQPTTKSRLDIGLNIKGQQPQSKLEASGSFNAMCTHRIRVEKAEDVDQETIQWLKKAYETAG